MSGNNMEPHFIPYEQKKKEIPIRDRKGQGKTLILKNEGYATIKGEPKNKKK